jgi:hypothetical protein
VRVTSTVEPDRALAAVYQDKYGRYQDYIAALRTVWDRPKA